MKARRKQPKPTPRKRRGVGRKGFTESLGPLDDALAGFWFSIPPLPQGGHGRFNESERRALIEHLKAAGFIILPVGMDP